MEQSKHSSGFLRFLLSVGVIVVFAGVVLWSLGVLPKETQRGQFAASVEQSIDALEPEPESSQPSIVVTVNPASISKGQSVVVTVVPAADIPIFWLMDIYLESPSGLSKARGSITNIDGEGRRFGSIALPSDAEPGAWKVKTIEITDTSGNATLYSFGTDIFSTFQVQ